MTAERLSAADFDDYDRSAPPSMVHLGVGAFARAHLGTYADALLRAGWPATIAGVSLRSSQAEEQLAPQDGLYSLLEREPGVDVPPRVLGAFTSVATGRDAALAAIAAPTTSVVTLTVTEKGYEPDEIPTVLVDGLARRDRTSTPLVVASLDNVADNGSLLRERVLDVAEQADPGLARWTMEHVSFPSSVVDRMVPATTSADLDLIAQRLGVRDEAAVVAEQHRSWYLADVDGLPPFGDVGVTVVPDVGPYQWRKLWLLNGPHSALAYGGLLAGLETIAEAATDPVVSSFVRRLVDDILEVADRSPGTEPGAFAEESLRRFGNPELAHTCRQVGTDGSRKLEQRLLPVVSTRTHVGLPTDRFAVVVAVWLAAVAGIPLAGTVLPEVDDPDAARLRTVTEVRDRAALLRAVLGPHLTPAFGAEVVGTLERLQQRGIDVLRDST